MKNRYLKNNLKHKIAKNRAIKNRNTKRKPSGEPCDKCLDEKVSDMIGRYESAGERLNSRGIVYVKTCLEKGVEIDDEVVYNENMLSEPEGCVSDSFFVGDDGLLYYDVGTVREPTSDDLNCMRRAFDVCENLLYKADIKRSVKCIEDRLDTRLLRTRAEVETINMS